MIDDVRVRAEFRIQMNQILQWAIEADQGRGVPIGVRPAVARRDGLKRDGFKLNRHHGLASCLSMIFSENRFPLFGIVLYACSASRFGT
jgi:hypothetical protein